MKTTITISKKLANTLNQIKYLYGFESIEEVIIKYLKIKKEVSKDDTENKDVVEKIHPKEVS